MKFSFHIHLIALLFVLGSCANAEKSAGTTADNAEMEASVTQLANDMCLAKNAVAQSADDPAKMAEYEQRRKEFDKRLAELDSQYSSEEQNTKLHELLLNMTSNCIKK